MKLKSILALITGVAIASTALGQSTEASSQSNPQQTDVSTRRAVYTQTNAADGNEVLVFRHDSRGVLDLVTKVKTRGLGTGVTLGSQGALALTRDGRHLYVVNAGSDSISAFAVSDRSLVLIGLVPSGGDQPISLTIKHDVLYVLNAGSDNITGFRVDEKGYPHALQGSTRALSGTAVKPAQVSFNNTGDFLAVTEKATNKIDIYAVDDDLASEPFVHKSNGVTPFGFAFDRRDRLVVSEAFGDAAGASAVSSYDFDAADAPLDVVSGSVKSGQTSACWVAIAGNGHYAYVANTGSGTISAYRIARNGELSLLATGVSASTGQGSKPQDLALGKGGLLFALTPGTGTLDSFKITADGNLTRVATAQGIPGSAQGLVTY